MPFGYRVDDVLERLARDVFHDHPLVVEPVAADVVHADQIRVLEIQTLRHAAQLDFEIAADQLERDFLAGVARGEIDFAETAATDATLDRVAVERPRAARIGEFHSTGPGSFRASFGCSELGRRNVHGRFLCSF